MNKTNAVYAKALSSQATPTDLADMDDVCAYVFQGDSTTTCTVKYDCAGNKICDKGFCADKVTKNKGQPCGNPGEVCATGSYCAPDPAATNANPVCLAKARPERRVQRHRPLSRDPALRRRDRHLSCRADRRRRILRNQRRLRRGGALLRSVHRLQVRFSASASRPAPLACVDYGGSPSPTPACSGPVPTPDAGTGNTDAGTDAATDVASGG